MVGVTRIREAPREACVSVWVPYSARCIRGALRSIAEIICTNWTLIDEGVKPSMGLVASVTLEVEPGICVCLRRGKVRAAELASFMRLLYDAVLPMADTGTSNVTVNVRYFECDECCGYDDDDWN